MLLDYTVLKSKRKSKGSTSMSILVNNFVAIFGANINLDPQIYNCNITKLLFEFTMNLPL
jgi:hypothetical protein